MNNKIKLNPVTGNILIQSSSRNLIGNALKEYKKNLPPLTLEQKDIIVGTLLGDSTMPLRKGKPQYNIKWDYKPSSVGYLKHIYNIFEAYVGTGPKEEVKDKKTGRTSVWFRTYGDKRFRFYLNFFYKQIKGPDGLILDSTKCVPKTIGKFLTPRAIAYWFMDDGTSDRQGPNCINYLFSTHGFKRHESQLLCTILRDKYGILANVHRDKDKYRIFILARSAQTLRELMEPYIHETFLYKLNGDPTPED